MEANDDKVGIEISDKLKNIKSYSGHSGLPFIAKKKKKTNIKPFNFVSNPKQALVKLQCVEKEVCEFKKENLPEKPKSPFEANNTKISSQKQEKCANSCKVENYVSMQIKTSENSSNLRNKSPLHSELFCEAPSSHRPQVKNSLNPVNNLFKRSTYSRKLLDSSKSVKGSKKKSALEVSENHLANGLCLKPSPDMKSLGKTSQAIRKSSTPPLKNVSNISSQKTERRTCAGTSKDPVPVESKERNVGSITSRKSTQIPVLVVPATVAQSDKKNFTSSSKKLVTELTPPSFIPKLLSPFPCSGDSTPKRRTLKRSKTVIGNVTDMNTCRRKEKDKHVRSFSSGVGADYLNLAGMLINDEINFQMSSPGSGNLNKKLFERCVLKKYDGHTGLKFTPTKNKSTTPKPFSFDKRE